jgi:hypothetical protein
MNPSDDQSWKVFQRDSEAGRLLSRLYGLPPSQSKVRRKTTSSETKRSESAPEWKTTYTIHTLSKSEEKEKENERKNNISRALSIKVPKVGRSTTFANDGSLKIDLAPRRRTETACLSNIQQVKFQNKKYRPPAAHAFSSDAEKQRLNDLFSGGQGKCLPEDLTSIPAVNTSNEGRVNVGTSKCALPESLFDQIYQEIKERREYQLEMEKLGAGEATRMTTVNEIQTRINQLRRIDPNKAAVVIKMLMN